MDNQLTFENQITAVKNKCFNTIRNIRNIRYLLSDDYGNGIYFGINERLQNAAAKAITKKYEHDHMDGDLIYLHWLTIKRRIIFKLALLVHKSLLGLSPLYIGGLYKYIQEMLSYAHYGQKVRLLVALTNTRDGQRSFSDEHQDCILYNKLLCNMIYLNLDKNSFIKYV